VAVLSLCFHDPKGWLASPEIAIQLGISDKFHDLGRLSITHSS
jgi:hypothetical protein